MLWYTRIMRSGSANQRLHTNPPADQANAYKACKATGPLGVSPTTRARPTPFFELQQRFSPTQVAAPGPGTGFALALAARLVPKGGYRPQAVCGR